MSQSNPLHRADPLLAIWRHPRSVIRQIVDSDPMLNVVLLTCLLGVNFSLNRAALRNVGDRTPVPTLLAAIFVIGPFAGLFSMWMWSHLVRGTGSWIGGGATREQIKAAVAWGFVPSVAALVLWLPKLALLGSENFTSSTPHLDASPQLWSFLLVIIALELILAMWSIVLLCNTVAEVQQFTSAWRGFANLLLAWLVLIVPLLMITFGAIAIRRS